MKFKTIILFLSLTLFPAVGFSRPPKVFKLYPENGAADVKPGPTKIRILFDQDMNTNGYSICGSGENFPEIIGQPKWSGRRAFVFSANLEPNHEYTFGINSPSFKNFKSISGEPAEVLIVTFRTAGKDGVPDESTEETLTPEENQAAFDALKIAITKNYSYRNLKELDWEALLEEYKARFLEVETPEKFVSIAKLLLSKAKDKHIWFQIGSRTIPCYINPVSANINPKLVKDLVPDFKKESEIVYSGQFNDGIAYIMIDSWSGSDEKVLEGFYAALNNFSNAPGLIIDVRGNSGGNEILARYVAGCFIDEPKLYAKNINIDLNYPGYFTPVHERYVEPNKTRPQYRGKVAVLIGPAVISSCEAFVLMMKQVPGCILVGEPTQGSSGNPQPYEIGNNITVFLPSWQALLPDETCFEGKGIEPDILVKTTKKDFITSDPVIDAAQKALTKTKK